MHSTQMSLQVDSLKLCCGVDTRGPVAVHLGAAVHTCVSASGIAAIGLALHLVWAGGPHIAWQSATMYTCGSGVLVA